MNPGDLPHRLESLTLSPSDAGKPHKLELWVKVEPNWSRNYWLLKKFGYVGT